MMKFHSVQNPASPAFRSTSLVACAVLVVLSILNGQAFGIQAATEKQTIIIDGLELDGQTIVRGGISIKVKQELQERAGEAAAAAAGDAAAAAHAKAVKKATQAATQAANQAASPETAEANAPQAVEESAMTAPPSKPKLSKKFVRFHMWDGSIVGGEVQIDTITVRTEFGSLEVPVDEIKQFHPGLNSFPELTTKIETLVQGLGDKNFDVREKSNRELSSMGLQIRNELNQFDDGGSAERKKRIAEIKKAIDEELDSMDDEELANDPLNQPLIRGDKVETPLFAIVGKIEQEEFVLTSKFGELTVKLADVRMADRAFMDVPEATKKKCQVDGHAFFQKNTHSTRIRVNKGDKVSISADGVIQWTNWSTSSTPDGLSNQGKYQNIQGGTLCARVGSSGNVIKIGSKGSFVAKKSGTLYLAIAMQDSYTNNSGYKWVGKYTAKVDVKPAAK